MNLACSTDLFYSTTTQQVQNSILIQNGHGFQHNRTVRSISEMFLDNRRQYSHVIRYDHLLDDIQSSRARAHLQVEIGQFESSFFDRFKRATNSLRHLAQTQRERELLGHVRMPVRQEILRIDYNYRVGLGL